MKKLVISWTWSRMFIAECSNGSEEIAGRSQNNSLCQRDISPGC